MNGNKYIVKVEDLKENIIFYDYYNGYEVKYELLQIYMITPNLWDLHCKECSTGLTEVLKVNRNYPRDFYTDRLVSNIRMI